MHFQAKNYLLHNKQCGKFSHINNNWTTIIKIEHALYPLFLFAFLGENLYSFEVHILHPHTTMGFKEKSHQIDQVWQKLI